MSERTPAVLMVHNYYRSGNPSGENASFEDEAGLLRSRGHRVITFTRHNDAIEASSLRQMAALAKNTVWSGESARELRRVIEQARPEVVHFQNTFPLLSPSVYSACREAGVPVVQAVRNYRLLCPAATLYREGRVCEDCLGKTLAWPGVMHRCYRDSAAQSAAVAAMLAVHRWRRTWQEEVDVFVAPSQFTRRKLIEGGLPAEKIVVKPNFVEPDPGMRRGPGEYALFIGRLSEEKGIGTLLGAWERLSRDGGVPLMIVGDGPLLEQARATIQAKGLRQVELLGRQSREETRAILKQARFLVVPSVCYETFGRVAVEAFACGVPVVASHIGALAELVNGRRPGVHFMPGDAEDLATKVAWSWAHGSEMEEMGRAARAEYEAKYTAASNYDALMRVYRVVMEAVRA